MYSLADGKLKGKVTGRAFDPTIDSATYLEHLKAAKAPVVAAADKVRSIVECERNDRRGKICIEETAPDNGVVSSKTNEAYSCVVTHHICCTVFTSSSGLALEICRIFRRTR